MGTSRRILILNERDLEHPKAGGAEIHVSQVFSRLAARGHRIVQLSSGFAGGASKTTQHGVEVERRGPLAAYYASIPGRLRRAGAGGDFDLVVECLNKLPFYAREWTRLPVLALCHHLFGRVAFQQVAWPIAAAVYAAELGLPRRYRDCRFVAISDSSRDDLILRGIEPEQVVVSHPGIDRPELEVDPERPRRRRIAYLGRLEAYKQIDVMLRATPVLARRFPDLEVLVIGRGPEREALERLAGTLGIAERTRFTGFVPDRERDALLADTCACVFPSEKEGWGLTVIEANALGTPVVARDAPGLRDSIRNGETGRLIASGNPLVFADALAKLLEEDEATLAMRRAALEWSKRFDWERAADEMEQAIERSLAEAGR